MFKNMFGGVSKKLMVSVFVFAISLGLANSILSKVSMQIIDNSGASVFNKFIVSVVCTTLIYECIEFILDVTWRLLETDIENRDYLYYLNRLYDIKPEVLKANNSGYISGVVNKLSVTHSAFLDKTLCDVPAEMTFIIYYTYLLFDIYPPMSLWLIFIIAFGAVFRLMGERISDKADKLSHAEGNRNRMFTDAISNMGTVQKMQAREFFVNKSKDVFYECNKRVKSWAISEEILFIINKLLNFLTIPVFMIMVVWFRGNDLFSYEWALVMTVALKCPHNTRSLAKWFTVYSRYRGQLNKLERICSKENIRKELYRGKFESLVVSDVDYVYTDTNTRSDVHIVIPKFEVNKGDFICISGESGQGKTTLLNILSGEIETGYAIINNSVTNKRVDCAFIAQDTEMFDMSIRDNLLLDNPEHIEDYVLLEYMDAVGLGDWLDEQVNGLDTIIGERGVFISTGQRQRLNLIRGLLKRDKELYLLDEPTSNVDVKTELRMVELIKERLVNKTVIVVTHRYAIMELSTKQYVFKDSVLREEARR